MLYGTFFASMYRGSHPTSLRYKRERISKHKPLLTPQSSVSALRENTFNNFRQLTISSSFQTEQFYLTCPIPPSSMFSHWRCIYHSRQMTCCRPEVVGSDVVCFPSCRHEYNFEWDVIKKSLKLLHNIISRNER